MRWDTGFSKGFHVEELKYFSSTEHIFMGLDEAANTKLDNIGCNGCHLTIAVLSMNRSNLTIRLMESIKNYIPGFNGEFLIGDNGSVESEKGLLYEAMKLMPYQCRMVEFGENLGVAAGRNRLFKEVHTEWILSADNDLYFVGNPLKKIQEDIAVLGCHFLSLPILNAEKHSTGIYGGHIYIENINSKISIGGGSALVSPFVEVNKENSPFLCTFIPGGAGIMYKKTFFECGAYDEAMFVGFEDIEFSLRVFQRGLKVGSCGMASIIHDHPKPIKKADTDYERNRFSNSRIKKSGQYFEEKHGFSVWNPAVEHWVEGRLNEMTSSAEVNISYTPKIALVIDARNWALDHIATQLEKYLIQYEFKKIYLSDLDNIAQVLMVAEECQVIHFLWRPCASTYDEDYVQNYLSQLGLCREDFFERYIKSKYISVAIYDHLFLEGKYTEISRKLFSNPCSIIQSYVVSSEKLRGIYNTTEWIKKKPIAVTPDGVDLTIFRPYKLERFKDIIDRPIMIGWVGNSKWEVSDLKGVNTIIKPAVEILKNQGYNVDLLLSDRQEKIIPFEEMPAFYSKIDIYICASLHEGTPNPVLEAMACGVPVISTDVGVVSEVFGEKQHEFILQERSVKCLVNTLKILLESPEKLAVLSEENLASIMSWDWSIMVNNFAIYFEQCLNWYPR